MMGAAVVKKSKTLKWAHEITKVGQAAVKEAVQQHLKAGNSVTVMRDGQVVKLNSKR